VELSHSDSGSRSALDVGCVNNIVQIARGYVDAFERGLTKFNSLTALEAYDVPVLPTPLDSKAHRRQWPNKIKRMSKTREERGFQAVQCVMCGCRLAVDVATTLKKNLVYYRSLDRRQQRHRPTLVTSLRPITVTY